MTHPIENLRNQDSLPTLQRYIAEVVRMRKFDQDTWEQVSVILAEELGELLKALRKYRGLLTGDNRNEEYRNWVQDEFADLLINLLDLANRFEIDLFKALVIKERKHIERFGC